MKNENKVSELQQKYIKKEVVPDMYKGVCIGDTVLETIEKEKDTDKPAIYAGIEYDTVLENNEKDKNTDEPAIYAGIEGITAEQKAILMMPPNHRVYPKLNLQSFETELEKSIIKAQWENIREERKTQEHFKALETGKENIENPKVVDGETKSVDYRYLKATDLKNNKRINIPEIFDEVEAIKTNSVKTELKDVFIKYMNDHCDKEGNVIDNNLNLNIYISMCLKLVIYILNLHLRLNFLYVLVPNASPALFCQE